VVDEEEGGDGLVGGENVSDFDAEDFEDAVGGGGDGHFAEVGVEFGELGASLGEALGAGAGEEQVVAAFGGSNVLLESADAGEGLVVLGGGDGFLAKRSSARLASTRACSSSATRASQSCLAASISCWRVRLGVRRAGRQPGRVWRGVRRRPARRWSGRGSGVAFLGEEFLDTAAVAGGDADLVGFNGAGDAGGTGRVAGSAAGGEKGEGNCPAEEEAELGLHATGR